MTKTQLYLATSLISLGLISTAAASPLPEVAIGPILGTNGVGAQLSTQLVPEYLNLNTGITTFGVHFDTWNGAQKFHDKLNLSGVPIYFSVFPFGSNFHLDAGIVINDNRYSMAAIPGPSDNYVLNGHSYPAALLGPLHSESHFNRVAPYIGIGWGDPFIGSNWTFTANAGVLLEGGPGIRIYAPNIDFLHFVQADIREAERTYDHDIHIMSTLPVLNFGLTYRF
jgi:hypothetical protein